MKIGVISPPLLKCPPTAYGGLEVVVFDLCEALAEQNHDVTLFAPNGSYAKGCKVVETNIAPERTNVNWIELEKIQYETIKSRLQGFDILADHTWFGFSYLQKLDPVNKDMKICKTMHGHFDWNPNNIPEPIKPVNLIAISKYMQSEYKMQGWESRYCYNGIDINKYKFYDGFRDDRLVFVGRITKIKGVHIALKVAQETSTPIDIIGGSFVGENEKEFLEAIKKECEDSHGLATLHLDLAHDKKVEYLKRAKACLIPSNFKEPFGLTAVESLAVGTPAIVWADGALGEIINDPKCGTVCRDYDAFLKACQNIDAAGYDQKECRNRAEFFSRENMATNYVKIYEDVMNPAQQGS
jgi:glycosyltransferase involved in cell wall biosynthesis